MPDIHSLIDLTVSTDIIFDNQALLIHHKKANKWLQVGGHVELDEDPEQTLFREITEETGLKPNQISIIASKPNLQSPDLKFLYTPTFMDIHFVRPDHRHICLRYVAKSITNKVKLSAQEHHQIKWFTAAELELPMYSLEPATKFFAHHAISVCSSA